MEGREQHDQKSFAPSPYGTVVINYVKLLVPLNHSSSCRSSSVRALAIYPYAINPKESREHVIK